LMMKQSHALGWTIMDKTEINISTMASMNALGWFTLKT